MLFDTLVLLYNEGIRCRYLNSMINSINNINMCISVYSVHRNREYINAVCYVIKQPSRLKCIQRSMKFQRQHSPLKKKRKMDIQHAINASFFLLLCMMLLQTAINSLEKRKVMPNTSTLLPRPDAGIVTAPSTSVTTSSSNNSHESDPNQGTIGVNSIENASLTCESMNMHQNSLNITEIINFTEIEVSLPIVTLAGEEKECILAFQVSSPIVLRDECQLLVDKTVQEVSEFLIAEVGFDLTSFEEIKRVYHEVMHDPQSKVITVWIVDCKMLEFTY